MTNAQDDLEHLWRIVDSLTCGVPERDRRTIYAGIACGVADGWRPARGELVNLVTFAVQQQSAARYDCA